MLETSTDVFWLVLSFVIFWIGIFVGLACYHLAMILKDAREVVKNIKRKIEMVDSILAMFKDKASNTMSYLPVLIKGATKIVQTFQKEDKRKKK